MRFLSVFLMLAISAGAFAGSLETVVAPPAKPVRPGQTAEFAVYVHNVSGEGAAAHLPARLSCSLDSDRRRAEVTAAAVPPFSEAPKTLEKNGFVKVRYAFVVPTGLKGTVTMRIDELDAAGVMFAVAEAEAKKTPPATKRPEAPEEYSTLESLFSLYQPYLVNLSAYEPMYFLVGTDPEKSKFQISFKYRFFDPEKETVERRPWMKGFFFGYTQTSFWDLKSDSHPFKDTSYKPELFFVSPNIARRPDWMKGFFLQAGFQHESNGRSGELSRSTNFVYAAPIFIFYDAASRYGLQISPRIWTYVDNDDETNPDLDEYRGYFDLEMKFGRADSFVLGSHFRWAEEGASIQLDLTYPLHEYLFNTVDFYFQAQYVNALAESLLDFRERSEALRLGFSIVR